MQRPPGDNGMEFKASRPGNPQIDMDAVASGVLHLLMRNKLRGTCWFSFVICHGGWHYTCFSGLCNCYCIRRPVAAVELTAICARATADPSSRLPRQRGNEAVRYPTKKQGDVKTLVHLFAGFWPTGRAGLCSLRE